MSKQFRLWIDGCEMSNTNLYELERRPDSNIALYMTKFKYEYNHIYYWSDPMYHVWYGDKHEVFFDYMEAYNSYMRKVEE